MAEVPEPTTSTQERIAQPSYNQLTRSQRIALAHEAWNNSNGEVSLKKISRMYGVSSSTLQGRIKGALPKERASQAMQKLSKDEEDALAGWVELMASWNWPVRTDHLREMARELLKVRGDMTEIGVHWHDGFLLRHKDLKPKFPKRMDAERTKAKAQEPDTAKAWFDLYQDIVTKYNIHCDDIYNMAERSALLGVSGKDEMVVSRHERRRQNNLKVRPNHQWISFIECIATTGKILPPWFIIKGEQILPTWQNALRGSDGRIALSEYDWSNNILDVDWFKLHFDRYSTPLYGDGGYRLLIVDGYGVQVTTQAIQFCIVNKIVLLCLPAYTARFLQPLDAGVLLPLATTYEQNVREQGAFIVDYFVDEVEFLKLYLHSRHAITIQSIQKAWEDTGLEPFNPDMVVAPLSAAAEQALAYQAQEENAFQFPRQMPKHVNGILVYDY